MLQMTYAATPKVGIPGQVIRRGRVTSYPAAEAVPFGVLLQLDSGGTKVQACQNTSSGLGKVVGLSIFEQRPQALGGGSGAYAAGDMVEVLQEGEAFGAWNGTTQAPIVTPNVKHASDDTSNGGGNAKYRGFFTDASTSTSAGIEVAAAPEGVQLKASTGQSDICQVMLNLPA